MESATEIVLELKLHPEVSPDTKKVFGWNRLQMNHCTFAFCFHQRYKPLVYTTVFSATFGVDSYVAMRNSLS